MLYAALFTLLITSGVFAYAGLVVGDINMGSHSWPAMALGIIVSLIVGCGLMALVFYSGRKGYDEPPQLTKQPKSWPD
jgi:hypothetical protein